MDEKKVFDDYQASLTKLLIPRAPVFDEFVSTLFCPHCHSDEFLCNRDGKRNLFCGACGQKLNWCSNKFYIESHDD